MTGNYMSIMLDMDQKMLWAAFQDNFKDVKYYVELGADIDATNKQGRTPLMLTNNPEIVTLLIDSHVDVDAQDRKGRTALMMAATRGNREIVALLLDTAIDIDARDHEQYTALMKAKERDHDDIVALLEANWADQ